MDRDGNYGKSAGIELSVSTRSGESTYQQVVIEICTRKLAKIVHLYMRICVQELRSLELF